MLYRVTQQYQRGGETVIAEFSTAENARIFVQAKLQEDARLKVNTTYRIFEGMDIVEVLGEADVAAGAGGSSVASSGSSARQSSSFQPTPFNMAPRPGGIPHSWLKSDEKKEGEKDK